MVRRKKVVEGLIKGCGAFHLMFDGYNLLRVGIDHKSLLSAAYSK